MASSLVRDASRSWGQPRQCLSRPDSSPLLPPEGLPFAGTGRHQCLRASRKGLFGRSRGSRRARGGCAKQTAGKPSPAGVRTGAWGRGEGGCGSGELADCKDPHVPLFCLGFVQRRNSLACACWQSLCGRVRTSQRWLRSSPLKVAMVWVLGLGCSSQDLTLLRRCSGVLEFRCTRDT